MRHFRTFTEPTSSEFFGKTVRMLCLPADGCRDAASEERHLPEKKAPPYCCVSQQFVGTDWNCVQELSRHCLFQIHLVFLHSFSCFAFCVFLTSLTEWC